MLLITIAAVIKNVASKVPQKNLFFSSDKLNLNMSNLELFHILDIKGKF